MWSDDWNAGGQRTVDANHKFYDWHLFYISVVSQWRVSSILTFLKIFFSVYEDATLRICLDLLVFKVEIKRKLFFLSCLVFCLLIVEWVFEQRLQNPSSSNEWMKSQWKGWFERPQSPKLNSGLSQPQQLRSNFPNRH